MLFFCPETIFLWTAVQRSQHKNVVFLVSGHGGDKQSWTISKKMDFWPKNFIFDPKFCVFLRYAYETTLFWLGRSRLNGMTTPPYPEVTLDTFGFPLGARLAARRAVLWPQLPEVALLVPKDAVFLARNQFFCGQPQNRLLQS